MFSASRFRGVTMPISTVFGSSFMLVDEFK